jgi:hypothetical protein
MRFCLDPVAWYTAETFLGSAGRPLCPRCSKTVRMVKPPHIPSVKNSVLLVAADVSRIAPLHPANERNKAEQFAQKYGVSCGSSGGLSFAELTIDIGPLRADGLGSVTGVESAPSKSLRLDSATRSLSAKESFRQCLRQFDAVTAAVCWTANARHGKLLTKKWTRI